MPRRLAVEADRLTAFEAHAAAGGAKAPHAMPEGNEEAEGATRSCDGGDAWCEAQGLGH